ncbi:MAG: cation:proton antiporter [Pseudomonadota bacterium]
MIALANVLFTVAGLLVLVGLLQPLAARLNLPNTVLLAVVGVLIGVGAAFLLHTPLTDAFNSVAELILDFPISSDEFLYIFLPILLFEAAVMIDVRRIAEDAAAIFVLAVIAVLVTTAVVGFALAPLASVSLTACLLFAAIIATTDPSAVVGIFRDIGAPGRLSRLVEGESLLNDATAIAIFTMLLSALMRRQDIGFVDGAMLFLVSSLGGAAVGYAGGRILMWIMPWLRDSRLAEMTLTLALPYLVYILCERYTGFSGVIAVVTSGLVVSALGRSRLTPDSREFLHEVWAQLAFWAGSLVFIIASMLVPRLLFGIQLYDLFLILVASLAALVARALVLFGFLPLLSVARLGQRVSSRYKVVILWGAMRGAVTLALALAVTENQSIDKEVQRFIAIMATGFVLLTLLVNATTLRFLIRVLKLDRLSPLNLALRQQVLALSLSNVRDGVATTAAQYQIASGPTKDVQEPYEARVAEVAGHNSFDTGIDDRDRIKLGVIALANRERELVMGHFRERTVSRRTLEQLLVGVEDLIDGARTNGRIGYNRAVRKQLAFGPLFRWAHLLHRRYGIDRPLALRLSDRFERLLVSRMVIEELSRFVDQKLILVLGQRVGDLLREIAAQRYDATTKALDALRLQYPTYADDLERRFLVRLALRLEDGQYATMFEEGLIGQELYNSLRREVDERRSRTQRRPRLDLGLNTADLIQQVPLFADLSSDQLEKIGRLLRPRVAVPGEVLVRRGERGAVMFFLSSGAAEVSLSDHKIRLGRGDFFGEMALLDPSRRRQADVTALSYCQLLILHHDDFRTLFRTEPGIREKIREVARNRKEANQGILKAE